MSLHLHGSGVADAGQAPTECPVPGQLLPEVGGVGAAWRKDDSGQEGCSGNKNPRISHPLKEKTKKHPSDSSKAVSTPKRIRKIFGAKQEGFISFFPAVGGSELCSCLC